MLKREKITDMANGADLEFLEDSWDNALIGLAESGAPGRAVLPCYGYQALKAILKDRGCNPAEMYARLQQLINSIEYEKPLFLTKYKKKELWQIICAKNFPRWDSLDHAIIGLGKTGWDDRGVVYSKPLAVTTIMNNQSSTSENKLLETGETLRFLEAHIIPVCLGEYTPWFVTPIA